MSCLEQISLILILVVYVTVGQDVSLINTKQGLVRGLESESGDYYKYLGIPYGVVNPNNPFGPSSPAPEFEDIFNATDDSIICPQEGIIVVGSLDCLHLNIFTPRTTTTLLPVLIFLHGGAFEFGSSDSSTHGPRFLVRHDVILVTLNYRLGVFGYMCTDSPRVPGNQASKDQLLALKWVNENIANFGGDPNRVTLSGNSAGGMSADLIIASNQGPKYFQQAIMQSGVAFMPSYMTPITRNAPFILAEHFGLTTNDIDEVLDYLASIDPLEVLPASRRLGLQFRPCIERTFDGVEAFITENFLAKDVVTQDLKIMIGFNENEALGLFLWPFSDLTNIVEQSLTNMYATEREAFTGTSEVRNFFFGDEEINHDLFKEAIDLRSDNSFVFNTMRSVRRYQRSGLKYVYLYLFSYDGARNFVKRSINTTLEGAAHADEIGYLFDVAVFGEPNIEDQLVIDRMTEMWTNFVKYGNPTPQPSTLVPIIWEPVTPTTDYYMHIDSDLKLSTSPYNERMAFWDVFLEINGHLQRINVDDAK